MPPASSSATPPAPSTRGCLRDIAANGRLVASVGSETNPRSTRSGDYVAELTPDGDGWRLTCNKFFASLAPAADFLLLWVAVPGDQPYPERTVTVLVPRDAAEVELIDQWDVMGMRPTVSWSVRIEDFPVPADAVFGTPGAWVRDDPRTFTLGFTANHIGAAHGAFDFALDWVRERSYMAQSDLTQHMLGEMASELAGARSALYAAADVWEHGDPDQAELESIKALHLAKRVLLDTTRRAFDVCGARAAFRLYPLEMMYRDARTFTLHFRDELTMRELGRALIEQRFSANARSTRPSCRRGTPRSRRSSSRPRPPGTADRPGRRTSRAGTGRAASPLAAAAAVVRRA